MLYPVRKMMYNYLGILPSSTKDKLRLLLEIDITVYKITGSITSMHPDIYTNYMILKIINRSDYFNEYALSPKLITNNPKTVSVVEWYSDGGELISNDFLKQWAKVAYQVYIKYETGIKQNKNTKGYANSYKLKYIIEECVSFVDILFKNLDKKRN